MISHPAIDNVTFQRIAREYKHRWNIDLCAVSPTGELLYHKGQWPDTPTNRDARANAVAESLRWGESTIVLDMQQNLIWAAPLTHNALLTGGLVAHISEKELFPDLSGKAKYDTRQLCRELRELAEKENVVNAALLQEHRLYHQQQQQMAEAIHELKLLPSSDIRQMYLREEPALLTAIRRDDRGEARNILNRILAAIHFRSEQRLDLTKSFFMELVVMMCRTAVEAGGSVEALFGTNFQSLMELSSVRTQTDLAQWLREILERIMDSIRKHRRKPHAVLAEAALAHIGKHYAKDLSRDDVAEALDLSPSHFSRLLKKQLGRSFTDLLNQMRINRATELLVRSDMTLQQIAREVGFHDQSYFTKVFKRYLRMNPKEYRREKTT